MSTTRSYHFLAESRKAIRAAARPSARRTGLAVAPADLLLAASAAGALLLALWQGGEQSSTSIAILLAALAARFGGLSALLVIIPLVVLPAHWLTRSELSWQGLVWDAFVALTIGALVADLRDRYRATQVEALSLRTALQEGQKLVKLLGERLGHSRQLMRHVGRARVRRSVRQSQLLADATFELLNDPCYATVYERIARMALNVLGDACRVDLWDAETRRVERYWTAAAEHSAELGAFLSQQNGIEQLPQIRQLLRHHRPVVIEPVAELTWPRLGQGSLGSGPGQGPSALLVVPVVIAGVVRVTIAVCRRRNGVTYDAATIALAEDYARRAAVVITHLFRLEHLLAARYRAEDAEQAKADVLAAFSHDMRTPLQAVNGYTQLLLEQIAGPLNIKQREYLQRIQQAQDRVTGFVDRVLTLARLDNKQNTGHAGPVELSTVAREVAALFALECLRKGLRIELPQIDDRVKVEADTEKVSRVLQNLLSNAVKYTQAGGAITLSWCDLGNRIEVVVSDNGRGVPKHELEAIFRPFYQVDPRSEGSGLGLAISRSLAHDMQGDLHVVSELGLGSTFTLQLPRVEPSLAVADPAALEPLVIPALAARQSA